MTSTASDDQFLPHQDDVGSGSAYGHSPDAPDIGSGHSRPQAPAKDAGDDWRLDHTAGRPILVYQNCSVIEAEQAEYVLRLIEADRQQRGGDARKPTIDDARQVMAKHRDTLKALAGQPVASESYAERMADDLADAIFEHFKTPAGSEGDESAWDHALAVIKAAQPAASAEPSDEEAAKFADQYGMYYDQDASIAGAHARALLSRYGRPAGDAQPVAWTTPDSREPISDAVKRARPDLYSKSYTVPLTVAAPVAAQSAMRTDRQRLRDLIDVVWNEATESTAVPDKPWADRMIDKVFGTASAQPAASAEPVTHHGDGPNNDEFFNQIARQGKKE